MIVGVLATYPSRRENLFRVVSLLAPQLDQLYVVLNEYDAVPEDLASIENVVAIIPPFDTKDTGKFYPDVSGADYVLTLDDHIVFPRNYVERTVAASKALSPGRYVASYHGSVYRRPRVKLKTSTIRNWMTYKQRPADFRKVYIFFKALERATVLDQIASGVAIFRGDLFPSFKYMRDSQKFVDVRLGVWAYENDVVSVALPKEAGWLQPIRYDETIFENFTQTNPPHVNEEILRFAYKIANRGQTL